MVENNVNMDKFEKRAVVKYLLLKGMSGQAIHTERKNYAKNGHLRTIAQLCRGVSSQLTHVSTIGKKLVKQ